MNSRIQMHVEYIIHKLSRSLDANNEKDLLDFIISKTSKNRHWVRQTRLMTANTGSRPQRRLGYQIERKKKGWK